MFNAMHVMHNTPSFNWNKGIGRSEMPEEKKKSSYCGPDTNDCGEPNEQPVPKFGITEAPKEHPDNPNGNLKVIME